MEINDDVATFNQQETKIILAALNVQTYVKSNSAGDQKSLDTPGITALDNLTQHIKKHSSVKLTDAQDLDSPDYAHKLVGDLRDYMIYEDSLSLLKPKTKQTCEDLQTQIKANITAREN